MKPFNLEEAKKKGVKSLVYRNKRKPSDCYIRQDYTGKWVICTWDDSVNYRTHDINGTHDIDSSSQWDLFMVEEEMWVNVYEDGGVGDKYPTKQDAIEAAKKGSRPDIKFETYKLIKE
jgi:hypothetical protein